MTPLPGAGAAHRQYQAYDRQPLSCNVNWHDTLPVQEGVEADSIPNVPTHGPLATVSLCDPVIRVIQWVELSYNYSSMSYAESIWHSSRSQKPDNTVHDVSELLAGETDSDWETKHNIGVPG